jgi:hypothetical protein
MALVTQWPTSKERIQRIRSATEPGCHELVQQRLRIVEAHRAPPCEPGRQGAHPQEHPVSGVSVGVTCLNARYTSSRDARTHRVWCSRKS